MESFASNAKKGFESVEKVGTLALDGLKKGIESFTAASAAVAGFALTSVKSGMTFDSTMSEVKAVSGATEEQFSSLRDKALEMGSSTQFSATEAAEALTYMARAGWKTDNMLSGISGIMNLAAASGENLALTSDIVTDALTAFGMSADESGHFADILAAASSSANTNVSMMGETFKYVAPSAGALGFSAEDTAIAIGLMANSGIKATQAGTSLRAILNRMASPTKQSANAMAELGLSLSDDEGNMKSLKQVMDDLRSGFGDLMIPQSEFIERLSELDGKLESGEIKQKAYDSELENLIELAYGAEGAEKAKYAAMLGGQEAMSGLLAIVAASPKDYEDLTYAIYNCTDAAEKMAAIMMDNLAGDVKLLKSALEGLQIQISDSLTPTLRHFARFGIDALGSLASGFKWEGATGLMKALETVVENSVNLLLSWSPKFATVTVSFIGAIAEGVVKNAEKIESTGMEISKIIVDGIDSWMSKNSADLLKTGEAIVNLLFEGFVSTSDIIVKYVGDFIPLIVNAFTLYHEQLFTAGLEILGAIGKGLVENKEAVTARISEMISNMLDAIIENAPIIIEGAVVIIDAIGQGIADNMPKILEAGGKIIGGLASGITSSLPTFALAVGTVVLHFNDIVNKGRDIATTIQNIRNTFNMLGELFGSNGLNIGNLAERLRDLGSNIRTLVSSGVTRLISGLQSLWAVLMANPIVLIIAGITALVAGFIYLWNTSEEFRQFWINLWENIKNIVGTVVEAIKTFFSNAWEAIKSIWSGVGDFFSGVFDGIKNVFSTVGDFFKDKFTKAKEAAQSAFENAPEFFSNVWDKIKNVYSNVHEYYREVFSKALSAIKDVWGSVADFFADVWEKIKDVFSNVVDFYKEVFTNAVEIIKTVFEVVVEFFSNVWEGIQNVFSTVVEFFGNIFTSAVEAIKAAWSTVVEFFAGIWEGIKNVFSVVAETIGGFFQGAWEKIKEIWSNAVDFFSDVLDKVKEVFSEVTQSVSEFFIEAWEKIKEVWDTVVGFFEDVWEGIKNVFSVVADVIGGFFSDAVDMIKSVWDGVVYFFQSIWEGIKGVFIGVGEYFKTRFDEARQAIEKVWDNVVYFFENTWENIKSIFSKAKSVFTSVGSNIVEGIKSGFKNAWESFKSWVTDTISSLVQTAKDAVSKIMNILGGSEKETTSKKTSSNSRRSVKGSYAVGTDYVPETGIYQLHKGEAVLTKEENANRYKYGDTYNFYSPKSIDAVSAAREMKKARQQLAMNFV